VDRRVDKSQHARRIVCSMLCTYLRVRDKSLNKLFIKTCHTFVGKTRNDKVMIELDREKGNSFTLTFYIR